MSEGLNGASVELFAYPWDIADAGPARFAEQCRELGVTRLHVTTLYHSGKFLLPRTGQKKVHLLESGTAWAPFDTAKLGDLRPAVAPIAQSGWLEDLASQDIPLSAWTVFHHNSRLGERKPELTVRNVFGDSYPFALCPGHEAVRDYSSALAGAIASLGCFSTVDLESIGFLGYVHGHHHEVAAGPLGPLEHFLLSLCFCSACRSAAADEGIAVAALEERIRALLLRKLNADDSNTASRQNMEQVAALLAQSPDLAAFVQMRQKCVTDLVRRIAAEVRPVGISPFTSSFVGSPSNIWMEGVSMAALSEISEAFHLLAYTPDTGAVNDDLLFCLSQVEDPGKVILTLNLGLPITPSLGDALAKVIFARRYGVSRFSFFNYGFLGEGRLRWIAELAHALRGKTASSQG